MPELVLSLPEAIRRAGAAYKCGHFDEAERLCRAILTANSDHFDAIHLLAIIQSRRGMYIEALANYDRALAIRPDYAEALNNRGNVLQELQRFEEAVASYDQALAIRPDDAEAYNHRGMTLHKMKRFDEALESYDKVLAIHPDYAEAFYRRGKSLEDLERYDEALASYERALAIQPNNTEALNNRGNTLKALKRFDEALASYDQALAVQPNYVESLSNRGLVLHELKNFDQALASYDQALAIRPNYAEVLFNRANTLRELNRSQEALTNYDQALAIRPNYVEALSNRGLILHELKNFAQALACYDQALVIRPDYAEVLFNRGNTLRELMRFEEALANYNKALAIRPNYAEAFFNRGLTFHDLNRFEDALSSYSQALVVKPDFVEVHLNEAICRLLIGDFDRGWEKYEWRWQSDQAQNTKRNFTQPMWLGHDDIADKTILLHAEQGFGDTMLFCRYVRLVADRAANVILEVQPSLKRLLLSGVTGARIVLARGEPLPHFDLHCPLLSLPRVFATRLATIPPMHQLLSAPPELLSKWESKLGPKIKPRVGIVWSGNPDHKNDHNRSISLRSLLPLLDNEATFVSLQKDIRADDAAILKERNDILNFGDSLKDFSDTAALVSNLDLVISVDTSVAHLAGALGKPVWVLLPYVPDWRWLIDRDDSPWYPTAHLFRQDDKRAWDGVIARVREALRHFIGNEHPRSFAVEAERTQPLVRQELPNLPQMLKRAVALHEANKILEAEVIYSQILKAKPDHFDAQHLFGVVRYQQGRHSEALDLIGAALKINANSAQAFSNYAAVLDELKRYDEAIAALDKALALNANDAHTLYFRATILSKLERFEEAVESYNKALVIKPDYAEALFNRGNSLKALNRREEALASYDKALAVKPNYSKALRNRGTVLCDLNRLQEALVTFETALKINRNDANALEGCGVVFQAMGRHDDAISAYQRALEINPLFANATHNIGMAHLLTGNFDRGWQEYEARFEIEHGPGKQTFFSRPRWLKKEQLRGKTILLHGEQGLGDMIMFVRYVPKVAALGATVILAIPAELKLMLGQINGVHKIFVPNESLPAFDFHCPLMSLPLAFGTTLETIPATIPYLHAPLDYISKWGHRLGEAHLPRIGIVWSGSPRHKNDYNRSIPLELLLTIRSSKIELVSLQKELRDSDAELLRDHPDIQHFGGEIKDFADTAALVSLMDLVISVDTSVAHLVGAMGKPVWILLPFFPDWRWLLEREDSPWYPTARLFRQPMSGNWKSVITRIKNAIHSGETHNK